MKTNDIEVKVAETREELEACFKLLHDEYVVSGFMQPEKSGLRTTLHHALPTTVTICAKVEDEVVATVTLIKKAGLPLPMESILDLDSIVPAGAGVAEVSALAAHPRFRNTCGAVFFPLTRFLYKYCIHVMAIRHLMIAVNPDHIDTYESMLFFERLPGGASSNYDFVNGAPAIVATLDLQQAAEKLRNAYDRRSERRNLHQYFTSNAFEEFRESCSSTLMPPGMLDYFFNERTSIFKTLDEKTKHMLHSIYRSPEYEGILPQMASIMR
ncbi:MAG: hypothetical protein PGN26_06430 [Xylophilus ampelinus]